MATNLKSIEYEFLLFLMPNRKKIQFLVQRKPLKHENWLIIIPNAISDKFLQANLKKTPKNSKRLHHFIKRKIFLSLLNSDKNNAFPKLIRRIYTHTSPKYKSEWSIKLQRLINQTHKHNHMCTG